MNLQAKYLAGEINNFDSKNKEEHKLNKMK